MADYHIIDRRENPKGKNLPNRQKFLKRVRKYLDTQVRDAMKKKSITDTEGIDISVPSTGIDEYTFDYVHTTGEWDKILPGNKEFTAGDRVKKPQGSSGGGGNNAGTGSGGDDNFTFTLTRDEYLDIVFEDLELPDLVKTSEKAAVAWHKIRSGFKTDGNPSQLDLVRSLKNSLGRRLALRKPIENKIDILDDKLKDIENEQFIDFQEEIELLKRKRSAIPWVDPIDLRYRRWDRKPIPNSQAAIFCLMDVSGSMGEKEKEIAKRFYLLLYLFLERKYEKVQIIFVRHTDTAEEVDEQEFFYSNESGGTAVSSGLKLVHKIIVERYPIDTWNIYVVQASDGDNYYTDSPKCAELMKMILPLVQYYVYAEVKQSYSMSSDDDTNVWTLMMSLAKTNAKLAVVHLPSVEKVVNVFRQVFAKEKTSG